MSDRAQGLVQRSLRRMPEVVALKSLAAPWALRAAAELDLMDKILEGADSIPALAVACDADADACRRLVEYLVQLGAIDKSGDLLTVTDLGSALLPEHPLGLQNWLGANGGGTLWDAEFANLTSSVRTGEPSFVDTHGVDPWTDLQHHPERAKTVREFMSNKTSWVANDVADLVASYEPTSVVDLGGGDTTLLQVIATRCPDASLTLIDPMAPTDIGASGIEALKQDVFTVSERHFDVVIANNVLHNWNDEDALRWLSHSAAMADVVVLVENVLDDDSAGLRELDLLMLVVFGGRERSADEYAQLAISSGLKPDKNASTAAGPRLLSFTRKVDRE